MTSYLKAPILFLLLLLPFASTAQYATGLILDETKLNDVAIVLDTFNGSKSGEAAFKRTRKVDLKPYCPFVQHQEDIGSCVGWAVGYSALTIEKAISNEWKGKRDLITQQAYSSLFIYNQIRKNDCRSGAGMLDAMNLLQSKGNLLYKDFENGEADCHLLPDEEQKSQASQHRIKDFRRLFETGERDRLKIEAIKKSLIQKHPIVIAMELKQNFMKVKRGDKYWWPDLGDTTYLGTHAMTVVGFDDGKQAFEIMNSWGSLWGNDGFIWVKYKDFARHCKYAFQLSISEEIETEPFLSANFSLEYPSRRNGQAVSQKVAPIHEAGSYKLAHPWPLYSRFQLIAEEITDGAFLYVFSLDATGKTHLHWPRDNQFDNKFTGQEHKAQISRGNERLFIPGPRKALMLDQTGLQQLCLLTSNASIPDLTEKLIRMEKLGGSTKERLASIFNQRLADPNAIRFAENDFQVEGVLPKDKVIAIVLDIEVKE